MIIAMCSYKNDTFRQIPASQISPITTPPSVDTNGDELYMVTGASLIDKDSHYFPIPVANAYQLDTRARVSSGSGTLTITLQNGSTTLQTINFTVNSTAYQFFDTNISVSSPITQITISVSGATFYIDFIAIENSQSQKFDYGGDYLEINTQKKMITLNPPIGLDILQPLGIYNASYSLNIPKAPRIAYNMLETWCNNNTPLIFYNPSTAFQITGFLQEVDAIVYGGYTFLLYASSYGVSATTSIPYDIKGILIKGDIEEL